MATTTQSTGPSPYLQGYYNNFLPGVFEYANQPYQPYGGPRVAGMSDIQYQALSGIQNQMRGNPMMQQAQGLLGGLMQGGGNPFMQQMVGDVTNQARRAYEDATGAINNRFTNPNSFGGSRHAMMQDQANEAFARGLGSALGNLQYNAYGEGLDRQMRASQLAAGLQNQQYSQLLQNFRAGGEGLDRRMAGAQGLQGSQRQRFNDLLASLQAGMVPRNIQQQQYDTAFEDYLRAQEYPRRNIDMLSRVLSGSPGSTTTTQSPDPNRTSQVLGGALSALPLFLSGFDFFKGK